jgi:hypothetical protein
MGVLSGWPWSSPFARSRHRRAGSRSLACRRARSSVGTRTISEGVAKAGTRCAAGAGPVLGRGSGTQRRSDEEPGPVRAVGAGLVFGRGSGAQRGSGGGPALDVSPDSGRCSVGVRACGDGAAADRARVCRRGRAGARLRFRRSATEWWGVGRWCVAGTWPVLGCGSGVQRRSVVVSEVGRVAGVRLGGLRVWWWAGPRCGGPPSDAPRCSGLRCSAMRCGWLRYGVGCRWRSPCGLVRSAR